jgi:hypothetical protein
MFKPGVSSKSGWSWKKKAIAGVAGATVLATALSRCGGGEEQTTAPAPAPTATDTQGATPAPSADGKIKGWVKDSWTYRYTAPENLPILESAAPDAKTVAFLKAGSCVEALPGADGLASRSADRKFAEVSAATDDQGTDMRKGWMALKTLSDYGSYSMHGRGPSGVCTATFITSAAGEAQKTVPVQLLSVSGSANFYNTADATSTAAGIAGDGSCIKTTGNQRGTMIEVKINGGEKPYWADAANFRPAPSHLTDQTCNAKFQPSFKVQ